MQLKFKKSKLNKKSKKIVFTILGIIAILALFVIIYCLFNLITFKTIYQESIYAKDNFLKAQNAVSQENFGQANAYLSTSEKHFNNASNSLNKIKYLEKIPFLGMQVKAVDNLLQAGINISSALQPMTSLGQDIYAIAKVQGEETSFAKISKKKKQDILQKLYESSALINESKTKLEKAVVLVEEVPDKGLLKPIKKSIAPIKDNLPLLKQLIDKAIPAVEVLPSIAGYPNEKTYLFLLQNNTELRPTGGFIGTYGILKAQNADISEFSTDNIYNLDNKAEKTIYIDKPEPMQLYLNKKTWLMRDCNWSPDYPTTAKKAEEFYHLESASEANIDGVIAVTPSFIRDLLKLTGPINIEGEEFNSDNFIEKLQYMVEVGYLEEGISDAARKDVIGKISSELMKRMLDLPKNQWINFWNVFVENVEQKQILLYMKDEEIQNYVQELSWDGRIKDTQYTSRDYVMIIDANLAALKTDRVMEKNIDYTINKERDGLTATLKIVYKNNGTFTNFTTRYRSYTRIYVPRGSELISSVGFLTNDQYLGGEPTPALVKQDEEFNKTIFEGFISVEPKSEQTIILKYKLPIEINDLLNANQYQLYFQKQPGTENYGLNFSFDVGKKIDSATSLDLRAKIDNNKVQITTDLNIDRLLQLYLK